MGGKFGRRRHQQEFLPMKSSHCCHASCRLENDNFSSGETTFTDKLGKLQFAKHLCVVQPKVLYG